MCFFFLSPSKQLLSFSKSTEFRSIWKCSGKHCCVFVSLLYSACLMRSMCHSECLSTYKSQLKTFSPDGARQSLHLTFLSSRTTVSNKVLLQLTQECAETVRFGGGAMHDLSEQFIYTIKKTWFEASICLGSNPTSASYSLRNCGQLFQPL